MLKKLASTSALVALALTMASGAQAMTFDKRTYFTFNQPITLPGVTLPAGTYVFHLADPTTSRKVTHVTNERGTQSYAMLLSMPAYRNDVPRDPEIQFMETASGMPRAVKTWWVAGERTGYEFIYSKEQMRRLTEGVAPEPVAFSAEPVAAPEAAEVEIKAAADEDAAAIAVEPERSEVAVVEGEPVEVVEQQPAPLPTPETTPEFQDNQGVQPTTRTELPTTAGPIPLLVLSGLGALAAGLRMSRKS